MSRVVRDEYDLVVTDGYALLSVAKTDACQQCLRWNGISLSPGISVVVTQQDMATLPHRDEALSGRCNIEKQ
jgi:hypothetical protein